MPRRVQDIIPQGHRSIREVSIPTQKTSNKAIRSKKEISEDSDISVPINRVEVPDHRIPVTPPPSFEIKKTNRLIKISKWPIITVVIILAIIILGYFSSTYYSRATFTIVPKVIPVSVNNTYTAQGSSDSANLFYEVITLDSSATTTVDSKNGPLTNTKSTGRVTLYNSYSASSVRLIAGTRLSNENGLIYRLSSSVMVPGYTKSGSTLNPGKINVNVVADQPGQKYDLIQTDKSVTLRIVAYSGSPKYTTIYAKPITNIVGGFSGVKKIVSPEAVSSSTASLKAKITEELMTNIKTAIPAGYIMYDKNFSITFSNPVIGGDNPSSSDINLRGTMYAIVFPKSKLIETVAGSQTVSLFSPFSYVASGLESLQASITNLKDFSPIKKSTLVVAIKGDIKIVGTVPVDEIKKKLSGIPLSETQDVFKSYSPVIESGSGELAPPWANIPTDLDRIKVIVEEL